VASPTASPPASGTRVGDDASITKFGGLDELRGWTTDIWATAEPKGLKDERPSQGFQAKEPQRVLEPIRDLT
jgi:hypothetical protein